MTITQTRNIAILGSTGSVGQQALEVIDKHRDRYRVVTLTAMNNAKLLVRQAIRYEPEAVVIGNESHYAFVKDALKGLPVKVHGGSQAINNACTLAPVDTVITALTGISGLKPTLNAISRGKKILLANKESLVVAGHLITRMAKKHRAIILPVDSEHSAVLQCLTGEKNDQVEKIYLTASGGPFRGMQHHELCEVSREQALKHPNWDMGDKISIDSATMMNKGLEMIEAKWMFSLRPEQIDVIIHPQSIVHAIVQFCDGSMKAQLGVPDMRHPIAFAMDYPSRTFTDLPRLQINQMREISFEPVKKNDYPCLDLAAEAMQKNGMMPCVLNAANEVAVAAFLQEQIRFNDIPAVISKCMDETLDGDTDDLDILMETDRIIREKAKGVIKTIS